MATDHVLLPTLFIHITAGQPAHSASATCAYDSQWRSYSGGYSLAAVWARLSTGSMAFPGTHNTNRYNIFKVCCRWFGALRDERDAPDQLLSLPARLHKRSSKVAPDGTHNGKASILSHWDPQTRSLEPGSCSNHHLLRVAERCTFGGRPAAYFHFRCRHGGGDPDSITKR